jgi:DNA ligase 4
MSESATTNEKKSKVEIEQLVKDHGGKFFQNENANSDIYVIGDRSMASDL